MSKTRLVRNAGASVLQVLLTAALVFITYRLLLQYLPMEQIGLWALIVGSLAVAKLAEFGLGSGIMRFVAGDMAVGDAEKAAVTISMAVVCSIGLVVCVGLIAYPLILPLVLDVAPSGLEDSAGTLFFTASLAVAIGTPSSIFLGAIDGCQRMDIRAGIQVAGNCVQLLLTAILLPKGGLSALGYVQMAQAGFLLIVGLGFTVFLIGARFRAYWGFDKERFREVVTYGGGLQLSAIAQMFFEPLAKVLLTALGGLALTGYFDVANRLILQCRGIIIAAYTAVVPYVAARASSTEMSDGDISGIYEKSFGLLLFGLLPYFAVIIAALPLILTLWAGRFDAMLLAVALIQAFGWMINSLNAPAYYMFVALGSVRPLILSHLTIGVVTLVLGSAFGWLFGGFGVLAGVNAALIVGSVQLLLMFHRSFSVPLSAVWSSAVLPPFVLMAGAVAFGVVVALGNGGDSPGWGTLFVPPLVVGSIGLVLAAFSNTGREVFTLAKGLFAP